MTKPQIQTVAGEGRTAREALEALAFSLRDEEVTGAPGAVLKIEVEHALIRELGGDETYAGFRAEVKR